MDGRQRLEMGIRVDRDRKSNSASGQLREAESPFDGSILQLLAEGSAALRMSLLVGVVGRLGTRHTSQPISEVVERKELSDMEREAGASLEGAKERFGARPAWSVGERAEGAL